MKQIPFIVLCLVLMSCASARKDGGAVTQDQIASFTEHHASSLVSLKADGSMATSVHGSTEQAQFSLSLYKTDSLLLSIFGPFGIVVGKLQANPSFFQFYDTFNNEIIEGAPTPENFQRIVNIPLSQHEIALLLRGEIPLTFSGFRPYSPSPTLPVYVRERDSLIEKVIISSPDGALVEYSQHTKHGTAIMVVRYSDFTLSNNIAIAKKISFQFPKAELALQLQYTDVETNVHTDQYSFRLPDGIKRTRY